MFKKRTIVLSVCGVFSMSGCASIMDQAGWKIEPSYGVEHSSSTPEGMYRLGRYYKGTVRYDKAIAAYQAALDQDPNFADAHSGLGVIYAWQGRYEEAIRAFQSAIAVAPDRADLHNNLGYAYLLQGSRDKAVTALEEARRLDPDNERVRHNLKLAQPGSGSGTAAPSVTKPIDAQIATPPLPTRIDAPPTQARSAPDDSVALVEVAPNIYELREQTGSGAVPAPTAVALPADKNPVAQVKPFGLEVSNGNGITGMARRVAQQLERMGVKTALLTNQLPFQQRSTELQYREGYRAEAAQLGSALHAPISMANSDALRDGIQVRLVLGHDVRTETALFAPGGSDTQLAGARPYRLEVSNGNGVNGMAQRLADRLERVGVKTARLTNDLPFQRGRTEIQYREGYRAEAAQLSASLQVPTAVVKSDALRSDIDVRLLLGRDVRSEAAFFEPGGSKVRLAAQGDVKASR